MLIEVHMIQNHAPSNLNRDDSGSPKSAIFGGYRRARISSQCLKRCYRTSRTFQNEVGGDLGMHTRSMPDEIMARLISYSESLTDVSQHGLRTKFEEWARLSQSKLASILGKANDAAGDADADESAGATDEDQPGTENEKRQRQSIFWRPSELNALFNAYRERIEWAEKIPDTMRRSFDEKGALKANDMVKALDALPEEGELKQRMERIKSCLDQTKDDLKAKYAAKVGESDLAKKGREKILKDETQKAVESAAKGLESLIIDKMEPKIILELAGLRPDGVPVDMCLFGRMVASPLMHNIEASSQFAHAISTHEWAREFDMWTRVDDRRDRRLDFYKSAFGADEKLESGTDGMGDQEFTSACYYSYFNVNFEALVDNLTGKALNRDLDDSADRQAAAQRACYAVVGLIKAAIFERPTGKFNSMATPSLPTLVVVELRDDHVPVSYVNAFARPVDPKNEEILNEEGKIIRVDLPLESANRLLTEANRINKAFARKAIKSLVFTGGHSLGVSLENGTNIETIEDLIKEVRLTFGCPDNANG